jgi:hypothetical protein
MIVSDKPAAAEPQGQGNGATAPSEGNGASEDRLVETFQFDPFGPSEEAQETVEAEAPVEAAVTPTASPAAPAEDPRDALAPVIGDLADAVRTMRQPPAPTEAPDEVPSYLYEIPQPMLQAIYAEDPAMRAKGLQLLVAATARAAHRGLLETVRKEIGSAVSGTETRMQQHMASQQQAQAVHNDFYGRYPQLNNPALVPLVVQVAQRLGTEQKVRAYTPAFGDAIAAAVVAAVQGIAPTVAKPTAKPQPAVFGGNARPAAPKSKSSLSDEIAEMLF